VNCAAAKSGVAAIVVGAAAEQRVEGEQPLEVGADVELFGDAHRAVQLHGAMGVTEELDIGLYFKRLLAFDTLFGGSAHHYRRHAALGGRTQV